MLLHEVDHLSHLILEYINQERKLLPFRYADMTLDGAELEVMVGRHVA